MIAGAVAARHLSDCGRLRGRQQCRPSAPRSAADCRRSEAGIRARLPAPPSAVSTWASFNLDQLNKHHLTRNLVRRLVRRFRRLRRCRPFQRFSAGPWRRDAHSRNSSCESCPAQGVWYRHLLGREDRIECRSNGGASDQRKFGAWNNAKRVAASSHAAQRGVFWRRAAARWEAPVSSGDRQVQRSDFLSL